EIAEVIRIERGAGKADVADDGVVVAVDEVGEVGADASAGAADLVAAAALSLVAEVHGLAALPVATLQLGDLALLGDVFLLERDPGQEEAVQRQRPGARILVGRVRDVDERNLLAGRHGYLQRRQLSLGGSAGEGEAEIARLAGAGEGFVRGRD